ncbi:hypothetical protein PG985_005702 [Apiospora marii]|uniref:uncharacterized protein n=1 Tax=Apiospora marii TaxID=335849 RepID=UPI00312F976A
MSKLRLLNLLLSRLLLARSFENLANRDYEGIGPGLEAELYVSDDPEVQEQLQEFTVGDRVGGGYDGSVYKIEFSGKSGEEEDLRVAAWKCGAWVIKKHEKVYDCDREYKAYAAFEEHDIAPRFGASAIDPDKDIRVGLILEFVPARAPNPASREDARGAMAALKRMHALGWVHGDLHIEGNVLVRAADGKVFLIDFTHAEQSSSASARGLDVDSLKGHFRGVQWDGDMVL